MQRRIILTFIEDFDTPDSPAVPAEEDRAALFTESDIAAHRASAWQEGYAAGRGETRDAVEKNLLQALGQLVNAVESARQELREQAEENAEAIANILMTAFSKMFPALASQHGSVEVQALAAMILPRILHEDDVRIQVSSDRCDALRSQIDELDRNLAARISLISGPLLGPADIVVRWRHGEVIHKADQSWTDIVHVLAPLGLALADRSERSDHRMAENVE